MLLSTLLTLKFIWFTYLINVEYNRIPIIIISTLISMFILALIYRKEGKSKNRKALTFYIIISIIMFIDATYYSHFNSLPNILAIKQVTLLTAVGDSLRVLIKPRVLVFILDIPLVIYYMKRVGYKPIVNIGLRRATPTIVGILLFGIILSLNAKGELSSVKAQEVYTYHATDIVETILGSKTPIEIEELSQEDIDELKSRAKLKEGKFTGFGKGKNLIVLQVEALQNFVINLNYNGQEITPNLNKLINDKSSVYYNNYFQLLGRGNTSDAEFVTQNSLYPSMEEPTYTQYQDNTFYGLPWLLRDNGYTAWAFHGYEKEFWNREKAYVNQGFQRFISEEDYVFEEVLGFGIRDEDFLDQTIDYLKELDNIDENPFYAFIITLSSHTPFMMPEEYHVLDIKPEHVDNMIGDYLQSIHYADKELGRFIDNLKKEGLYEDAVIALYGDHFAISTTQDDAALMKDIVGVDYDFDVMKNIPLVIHVPGEELGETISTIGSQLDFYPTIANIMGYDNTKGLVFGRDLTNYKGRNYIAPQTYMLKGSFIDEDVLFEISRDGIFENSRAIDRHTRKELDVEQFRQMSEDITKEIDKSNYILKKDYLKGDN
ncbi:MAG: LTA synthase family protein [Tissierellaceae bacterium]|nr:LTA synthase family protein [Tissierellaceae bacterium]